MSTMKETIRRIPVFGAAARYLYRLTKGDHKEHPPFSGSKEFWEQRYASGGDSGVGSFSKLAQFKASVINDFVDKHHIATVIELGCGDGNQLLLARYPKYLGLDVSETAIALCKDKFASDTAKSFKLMSGLDAESADLALSLDVIYHLVEDATFSYYMQRLFHAANRYVIIYSSDYDDNAGHDGPHVKHRKFTKWIEDNQRDWGLISAIPNIYPYTGDYRTGSSANFYIYGAPGEGFA